MQKTERRAPVIAGARPYHAQGAVRLFSAGLTTGEVKDGKSADVKVGWIKEDRAVKMRLTTIFVDE